LNTIQNRIAKVIAKPWFYPLALLFIGLIAYGLMLPRLGFYWDDWEGVYLYHLHLPSIGFSYYAERPVSAIVYLILFPLIKMTPLVTQSVSLALLCVFPGFFLINKYLWLLSHTWPGT
jgi:hypothetical protein